MWSQFFHCRDSTIQTGLGGKIKRAASFGAKVAQWSRVCTALAEGPHLFSGICTQLKKIMDFKNKSCLSLCEDKADFRHSWHQLLAPYPGLV